MRLRHCAALSFSSPSQPSLHISLHAFFLLLFYMVFPFIMTRETEILLSLYSLTRHLAEKCLFHMSMQKCIWEMMACLAAVSICFPSLSSTAFSWYEQRHEKRASRNISLPLFCIEDENGAFRCITEHFFLQDILYISYHFLSPYIEHLETGLQENIENVSYISFSLSSEHFLSSICCWERLLSSSPPRLTGLHTSASPVYSHLPQSRRSSHMRQKLWWHERQRDFHMACYTWQPAQEKNTHDTHHVRDIIYMSLSSFSLSLQEEPPLSLCPPPEESSFPISRSSELPS